MSNLLMAALMACLAVYVLCCYDGDADPDDAQWQDDENFHTG